LSYAKSVDVQLPKRPRLVSFPMIFEALKSELFGFKFENPKNPVTKPIYN